MGSEVKPKFQGGKSLLFAAIISFIIYMSSATFAYFYMQAPVSTIQIVPTYYNVTSSCALSMCDCRCYSTVDLPELKEHKLCASDCNAYYDIIGCQKVDDGDCVAVFSFEE